MTIPTSRQMQEALLAVADEILDRARAEATQTALDLAAARADLEATQVDLEAARVARDDARGQLAAAAQAIAQQKTVIAQLTATVEQQAARIRELEAGRRRTWFGACPIRTNMWGGASLAAAEYTVERWGGKDVALRQFYGALSPVHRPDGAAIVHASFKPDLPLVIGGIHDEGIRALAELARPGDVLEIWHEADKKVNDGLFSFEDVVAAKNRFYDVIKATNPDVLVANTLTGWLFDPKSENYPDRWAAVKADVLGIDCDGIRPTKLPYVNFVDEIARAVRFVADHGGMGYRHWAVPEFGCPRIVADDPEGTIRAQWLTEYAGRFSEAGALYVAAYEYNSSDGYALSGEAERAAWGAAVRGA